MAARGRPGSARAATRREHDSAWASRSHAPLRGHPCSTLAAPLPFSPATLAVLTRSDLAIAKPKRTIRAAAGLPVPEGTAEGDAVYRALVALVAEHGGDHLAENAETYGLVAGDSSTVLIHTESGSPWQDAWPPEIDRASIMTQLDTGLACDAAAHLADSA